MGIGNTTNWAEAFRETYVPSFEDATVLNNELLGMTLNGQPVFP